MPTAKSPMAPAPALPNSVENSYRLKCIELKKRIREIEDSNNVMVLRIERSRKAIQRARLERAILLQAIEERTEARVDDSEGSPSPPPTPKDKPLRIKRARKDTHDSPSRQHSQSPTREVFPMSSYQSTFTTINPTMDNNPHTPTQSSSKRGGGRMARGGPKRPANAYMIFCDKERDNVRKEGEGDETFDLHKALAKAWRDLGQAGQKPYFDEYEDNKLRYQEERANIQSLAPSAKRAVRQMSVGSSEDTPRMEVDEDSGMAGGGFTAVNK